MVDRLVLDLLETGRVQRTEFLRPAERPDAVYLNEAGREHFLTAYEELMQQRVRYPLTGNAETWRRCVFLQVQQMARVISGEAAQYQPLRWPGAAA